MQLLAVYHNSYNDNSIKFGKLKQTKPKAVELQAVIWAANKWWKEKWPKKIPCDTIEYVKWPPLAIVNIRDFSVATIFVYAYCARPQIVNAFSEWTANPISKHHEVQYNRSKPIRMHCWTFVITAITALFRMRMHVERANKKRPSATNTKTRKNTHTHTKSVVHQG